MTRFENRIIVLQSLSFTIIRSQYGLQLNGAFLFDPLLSISDDTSIKNLLMNPDVINRELFLDERLEATDSFPITNLK